ncbi:unnamed protein product [Pylaiella littoralis]
MSVKEHAVPRTSSSKIGLVKKIKKKNRLLIESINMGVKHMKPLRPGQNGEIKRIECPIHSSNVSLYEE